MKVTVDFDCTPEEARRFLGLPDVTAMQAALMEQVQERLESNMKAMDLDSLMSTWLPAGMQSMEQMQKMFWAQMGVGGSGDDSGKDGKDDPASGRTGK